MDTRKISFIKIAAISSLLTIFWSASAYAQPQITSFSGSLSNKGNLTITGSGFGTKSPVAPLKWDDFENGTIGNDLTGWPYLLSSNGINPKYANDQLRPNSTLSLKQDFTTNAQYNSTFGLIGLSPQTKYYITFYKYMTTSGGASRNYKIFMLWGGAPAEWDKGPRNGFTYFPYTASSVLYSEDCTAPVSTGTSWGDNSASAILTNSWNRFEWYIDVGDVSVANAKMYYWLDGILKVKMENFVSRTSNCTPTNLYLNAYFATDTNNARSYMWVDDVYVDITQARVEIGNAPTWAASTHREIQIPSAWSDTSITVTLNQGSSANFNNGYLYVIDADGNVNTNGYLLSDGGGGGGGTPPPSSGGDSSGGNSSSGGGGCGFVKDNGKGQKSKGEGLAFIIMLVIALAGIALVRRVRYLKSILFFIIFLFHFSIANATEYYVDQNNSQSSDSNPGTEVLPWITLTKAANTMVAGDTVIVKAGKYIDPNGTYALDSGPFNPANSGTASNPIIFKSQPQQAAILAQKVKGVGPAISINQRSYIIIDGFKVEGLIGISSSDHVTVQNCEVIYGGIPIDPSLNWGMVITQSNYNTVKNNYVYNMLNSGNNLHNSAGIMVHASSIASSIYNIIENNLVDAGGGIVYSAYGQKGGNITNNIWRKNIAKNATTGFLGMGSTDNTQYSDDNEYYNNIIYDTQNAFELDHNSRRFKIYNNTAFNCTRFLNGKNDDSNKDEQVWNNIVSNCTSGYHKGPSSVNWTILLNYADYNNFYNTNYVATWNWGSSSYKTIADWRTATGFDNNSFSVDPLFTDTTLKNFHLQGGSLLKGKGKNGEDIGAYATGNEQIGPDWQLTDGGGGGGGTPPPSSGSGGDSGGGSSGGSGCGFVKNDGKGLKAKG